MKRTEAQTLDSLIGEWIREQGLEQALLAQKMPEAWEKVLGQLVTRYTRDIEVKEGTLYVRVLNAALRQELFEQRFTLVQKLNEAAGGEAIKDIRLLV